MLEDKALLVKLKCGDVPGLERVYEKYKQELLTISSLLLAGQAEAEEVLREVFVSLAESVADFRVGLNLRSYLIGCAIDKIRDKLRDQTYEVTELKLGSRGGFSGAEEQPADRDDIAAQLCRGLAEVPFQQREAVILHLQGKMSFREIAEFQGASVNTVQGRYRYGLEKLRSLSSGEIEAILISSAETLEQSIGNLRLDTNAQTDERILRDASSALAGAAQAKPASGWLSICEGITRSRIAQAAVLTAVIAMVSAGVFVLGILLNRAVDSGTKEGIVQNEKGFVEAVKATDPNTGLLLESGLALIERMFEAGDVEGLARIMAEGPFETQLALLSYLERQGGSIPIELLERLLAECNRRDVDSSFASIIKDIMGRRERPDSQADDSAKGGVFELLVMERQSDEPLEGVSVGFSLDKTAQKDKTDAQGRCRIELGEKQPQYLRLLVSKEGFVPILLSYPYKESRSEAIKEYRLFLERGQSIGGIVQDEQAEPIEGVTAYLRIEADQGIERVAILDYPVKTDSAGRWKCDIVPWDFEEVKVRLSHADYVDDETYRTLTKDVEKLRNMTAVMVMEKDSAAGEAVVDNDIELIEGQVYLPDGGGAAGADVVICTGSEAIEIVNGQIAERLYGQIIETGGGGRFLFSPPKEDYALVIVNEQGYAKIDGNDFESYPEITLERWGRVEGELRIGSQAGWGEAMSLFYEIDAGQKQPNVSFRCEGITDVYGGFVFEHAVSGRAIIARRVVASSGMGGVSHFAAGYVRSGETVFVTIGGTGRPISGSVAVAAGYEGEVDLSNSYGTLAVKPAGEDETVRESRGQWGFVIEEDGSFWIDDVPAGRYELNIRLLREGVTSYEDGDRYRGEASFEFEVPEMADGRSDEPLDLGVILLDIQD